MQLKIEKLRNLPWERYAREALANLPKVVIYVSCFILFYNNVHDLTGTFLQFNTTVLIRYDLPDEITFPAVTVCGCVYQSAFCRDTYRDEADIIREDGVLQQAEPVLSILRNRSLTESRLVSACHFVYDSRQPDLKTPCSVIQPPLASLINGRKCFTFFSKLNRDFRRHTVEYHQALQHTKELEKMRNAEQYTWFIQLAINLNELFQPGEYEDSPEPDDNLPYGSSALGNKLMDADTIISVHSPLLIPNSHDSEFVSIDAFSVSNLHFTKQITRLLTSPYNPRCKEFNGASQTRTANECTNVCLMKSITGENGKKCINYHFTVTEGMLVNSLDDETAQSVHFCNASSYLTYVDYISARNRCLDVCGRDCEEENYSVVSETTPCPDSTECNPLILVIPDRKLHEVIQHSSDMDFYQFIGCLGGHCHLWLGLSAIQLYDVVYKLIRRVKALWGRFVEW